jgi:hypothetical protein
MDNGSQHLSAPSFLSLHGGIANDATEPQAINTVSLTVIQKDVLCLPILSILGPFPLA